MSALPTETSSAVSPLTVPQPVAEIDHDWLVTEDHKPVDRIFIEKLYRLLTRPLNVVIEAVSDLVGGEESFKKLLYAQLGVPHYAVFDPRHLLSQDTLRTYELVGGNYQLADPGPWSNVGLGLRLWEGKFEGIADTWLRWCDAHGAIIPTGEERARQAEERIRQLEAELRLLQGEASSETR